MVALTAAGADTLDLVRAGDLGKPKPCDTRANDGEGVARLLDGPARDLEPPKPDESYAIDDEDAARRLDGQLWRLSHQEALCRRTLGRLADRFLRTRAQGRLGFSRLGDYTRERLGMSARELQSLAQVARCMDALPDLADAFENGDLNWTKLRQIAPLVSPRDEHEWLALAVEHTSRELAEIVKNERRRPGSFLDQEWRTGGWPRPEPIAPFPVSPGDNDDIHDTVDGEPRMRLRLPCPARLRSLWRRVFELAKCSCGSELAPWQALEAVAAEGMSSAEALCAARDVSVLEPRASTQSSNPELTPTPVKRRARRTQAAQGDDYLERRPADPTADESWLLKASLGEHLPGDVFPAGLEGLGRGLDGLSASELDRRMREVVAAMQRIDWQMGCLLRTFYEARLFALLGFDSFQEYVGERLGVSPRKARSLVRVERARVRGGAELGEAYKNGELSLLQVVVLLPVLSRPHVVGWIERAGAVTVRRLAQEVEWACEMRERGAPSLAVAPRSARSSTTPIRRCAGKCVRTSDKLRRMRSSACSRGPPSSTRRSS